MHQIVTIIAKYFVAIPIVAVIYVAIRLPQAKRLRYGMTLVAGAIVTAVLVKIATSVHQDPRPFIRDGVTPYFKGSTDNGFPSDHTVFSALIAMATVYYSKRLGIGLLVLALVIGSARVIAGVHHGQDIIGGFLIAVIGVVLAKFILDSLWSKHSKIA